MADRRKTATQCNFPGCQHLTRRGDGLCASHASECSSSQFDVLRDEEIPVILIDIVGSILELIARSMRSEMVISASVAFVRTIASVVQNENVMQAVGLFINTIADALEEKSFTDPIASILLSTSESIRQSNGLTEALEAIFKLYRSLTGRISNLLQQAQDNEVLAYTINTTLLVSLKTVRNALVIALRVADDPTVQRVSGTMQSLYQTVVAHPVVAGSASLGRDVAVGVYNSSITQNALQRSASLVKSVWDVPVVRSTVTSGIYVANRAAIRSAEVSTAVIERVAQNEIITNTVSKGWQLVRGVPFALSFNSTHESESVCSAREAISTNLRNQLIKAGVSMEEIEYARLNTEGGLQYAISYREPGGPDFVQSISKLMLDTQLALDAETRARIDLMEQVKLLQKQLRLAEAALAGEIEYMPVS